MVSKIANRIVHFSDFAETYEGCRHRPLIREFKRHLTLDWKPQNKSVHSKDRGLCSTIAIINMLMSTNKRRILHSIHHRATEWLNSLLY